MGLCGDGDNYGGGERKESEFSPPSFRAAPLCSQHGLRTSHRELTVSESFLKDGFPGETTGGSE